MKTNALQNQSAYPADWSTYYSDLQTGSNIPDASSTVITQNVATFRGMFQDLSVIKESLRQSGYTPVLTTIYTDVLTIPDLTNLALQSSGLIIFARRIEVTGSAEILLDYRQTTTAQLIVFAGEMEGTLSVSAVKSSQQQPVIFSITQDNVSPGISINNNSSTPVSQSITLQQGFGMQAAEDMQLYLSNSFIFGSLLYDQNPDLALSIFLWVKGWAAQSTVLQELFYRSTSIATLLNAQINATANGAVFVPYLTAKIYTTLAGAFAASAAQYESNYQQLYICKTLTDENISMAKTMVANSQSEITYVNALLQQANANYKNAVGAATIAQINFNQQKIIVKGWAAEFQQRGIPDYQRNQTIKAIVSLVTALVTFGAAIAAMAVGDEAAAPVAAESAVSGVKAVADAAGTGAEIAKTASDLADTMGKLKTLVETLQSVYKLAQSVYEVAGTMSSAAGQMGIIQEMQDTTNGADLSAADGWAIYKIQTDNLMQDPVDKGIGYAKEYLESLDILVVYGQSLSAAQLAVITAGQQVAAITFQSYYARQKQDNLQLLVNNLQAGEAPLLSMMQQFYQKYLDSKSSLFAALKSYQASYFYWALRPSAVVPKIADPVSDLNAGIQNITNIEMDTASALEQFDPPPQQVKNILFEITDADILSQLRTNGSTSWVLPIDNSNFTGLNRVRLSTIRIWIDGINITPGNSVSIVISTAGNYLDKYAGLDYQFNSKALVRRFNYMVTDQGLNPDWRFDNGTLGFIQVDGTVDKEVSYAYFQPTPFSEWSIALSELSEDIDYSKAGKITMYFEGTAIGQSTASNNLLTQKTAEYA